MYKKAKFFGYCAALVTLMAMVSMATKAEDKPLPNKAPAGGTQGNGGKSVFWQSGNTQIDFVTSPKITKTSALSTFFLGFNNSDHKIKHIVFSPWVDKFRATFKDDNGDDTFSAGAHYWNIPGAIDKTVSFNSANHGGIRGIPLPPENYVLALNGFSFLSNNNSDCKVQEFHIGFNSASNQAIGKLVSDCQTSLFNGYLYYVWIPTSAIAELKTVSGDSHRSLPLSGELPKNDKYILRSVNLKFTNGAHFIKSIGVHLDDVALGKNAISWQDNNRDDPIQWSVEYYVLK